MSPYVIGVSWGNIWATQSDIEDALSNLLELRVRLDVEEWCQWFVGADQRQPACQRILRVLWPAAVFPQSDIDTFWSFLPDGPSSTAMLFHPDFVLGFADGALEVWDKMQTPQSATRTVTPRTFPRSAAGDVPRESRQRS